MRVGVVGAGAIGGWVAARLARAGNAVMALSSRGPLDRIEITEQGETLSAQFTRFDGAADVLLFAVKAPALAAASAAARPLIGPDTTIVPMLNGILWWFVEKPLRSVDPEASIAAALALEQLVGCVVHASCRRTAPDRIEVVHAEKLILGEPAGGTSERVAGLCGLCEDAGMRCDQSDDIRSAIWYKLWGNATINPLSALTRSTADRLLGDPVLRGLMAEAMDELAAVGAAIGCPISQTAEDRMAATARLGAFKSSMLQDVEAGRPIELEALLGAPREIAASVGLATPQLDRIYALARQLGENLRLL
ncbi:MAG: 2-dehydropantoate 2-reductase [Sphingomonas sp.]|nr:2-dehydropantoate 2-reductase [Sphingomonas sp.]